VLFSASVDADCSWKPLAEEVLATGWGERAMKSKLAAVHWLKKHPLLAEAGALIGSTATPRKALAGLYSSLGRG